MAKVAEVVAATLGIRDSAGEPVPPAARLADALRGRRLLLVLDNCEHVVESVAELAAFLLGSAPELRILATSREPLGVAGEVLRAVPPLDLPDPAAGGAPEVLHQSSAVRLFAARAAAAAPGFTLNAGNAHAVAAICRRLDGIPLALELAATRVRALGVHDLAARLDHRFRLLAAGYRGAPPRHQTLRATIDWSWRLATGPERTVLRRLAVHVEGCTLEAAEQVCAAPGGKRGDAGRKDAGPGERAGDDVDAAEVLGLLARLVDRSLVAVVDGAGGLRYRLLESVSAYGVERLREAGELEEVRQHHRRYYRSLAERAVPHLRGGEQRRWLERLDAESANLRSAVDGTVRHGAAEDALRLAGALAWYWFLRGRLSEARRSLEAALAVEGDAPVAVRAAAMAWLAGVRLLSGHGTAGAAAGAGETGDKALRLYDDISDQCGQATATWFLGFATSDFGDPSVSEALVDRALASFRAANNRWGVAAALSTRAKHAHLRGDLAGLRSNSEQSLDLFRELGDRWGQLQATEWLGALAEIVGDYQEATRLHRDGLRLAEELGLWPQVADRTSWLGRVAMLVGDYAQARELLDRGKRLAAEQSYKPGEIFAELALGQAARREGELDAAETHLRCVLDWCRRVDLERGVASALTLAELGFVAERRGDAAAARARHLQSFIVAQRLGDRRAKALAMEGLAGAQALAGHHDHAALLLGAAAAARQEAGAPLPVTEQGDVTRATQRARATLGEEAFAAGYRRGRSLAPDDALAALGLPAPSRTTI
jgi:predicted ATPase